MNDFIDEKWYRQIRDIKLSTAVGNIMRPVDNGQLSHEFTTTGQTPNLLLNSTLYTSNIMAKKIDQLAVLKKDIANNEPDELVRIIYNEKITELQSVFQLLNAALERDWKYFRDSNQLVYGIYDKNLQSAAAILLMRQAQKHPKYNDYPEITGILESSFNEKMGVSAITDLMPEQVKFNEIRKSMRRYVSMYRPDEKLPMLLSLSDVGRIAGEILREHAPEYKVVFIEGAVMHFRVSHAQKALIVAGKPDAKIHRSRFYQLVVGHEIGIHIMRRHNASSGKVGLFIIGGAGASTSEEGLGILAEQIYSKDAEAVLNSRRFIHLLCRYYAVGLALNNHDFKFVYNFFKTLYPLIFTSQATDTAHKYSWHITESVFRGTPADDSGTVFTRPSIYLKHMLLSWQALVEQPELVRLISNSRFNVLDHSQVQLINRLTP